MLLYHFGSREGLLVAVARAVEEAERARFLSWGMTPEDARRIWERLSDPVLWPSERLFFELYVQALLGRLGDEQFLDSTVEAWIAPVAAAMVRGLLLDLLATKDRDGVTEAFDRFVRLYETADPDASAFD
jgi:AcrR family transcriptional regulator